MKKLLMLGAAALPMIVMQAAGEGAAAAAAAEGGATAEQAKPAKEKKQTLQAIRFTDDQIKEIRSLRAMVYPAGHEFEGRVCWSHAALARKFNTNAGTISQIVRNRTYKDENYVPTNDGHLDRRPQA